MFLAGHTCCYGSISISYKIIDTFIFLTPYFVTVILFALLACPFSPPLTQTMLCRNYCDLAEQASNIEWGSGLFSTIFCAIKRVVLFGALKVLWKDDLYCVVKMITTCSPMIGQYFDTMIVASSDKEWLKRLIKI